MGCTCTGSARGENVTGRHDWLLVDVALAPKQGSHHASERDNRALARGSGSAGPRAWVHRAPDLALGVCRGLSCYDVCGPRPRREQPPRTMNSTSRSWLRKTDTPSMPRGVRFNVLTGAVIAVALGNSQRAASRIL